MTDEAMSPLRRRMIEDMTIRRSSRTVSPPADTQRPCPAQRWRSRISSAAMDRRGVKPTPAT
jgi:hypothetical protein